MLRIVARHTCAFKAGTPSECVPTHHGSSENKADNDVGNARYVPYKSSTDGCLKPVLVTTAVSEGKKNDRERLVDVINLRPRPQGTQTAFYRHGAYIPCIPGMFG